MSRPGRLSRHLVTLALTGLFTAGLTGCGQSTPSEPPAKEDSLPAAKMEMLNEGDLLINTGEDLIAEGEKLNADGKDGAAKIAEGKQKIVEGKALKEKARAMPE